MDHLGIDIGKTKFDVCLLAQPRDRHASFANTEAGFMLLRAWLDRHRTDATAPLHACMEATGNWGLDVASLLHQDGITVSIVNPKQIKSFGDSELARNKTDRLDAALIARFCRAHTPRAWTPPNPRLRELRDLVRRCDALKAARTQEINRQKAGCASAVVAASIAAHLHVLAEQIASINEAIRTLIAEDPTQQHDFNLLCGVPGIGEVTAAVLLAELPNITAFTPKALAAFAGLSPAEHSSGRNRSRSIGISRIGSARLRSALYLCALSARRHNPRLAAFVRRMAEAGKPPKVILVAIARRLLVYAHTVLRKQTPFRADDPATEARLPNPI